MRILVTGVSGFIGSHFARYLINNTDYDVVGFARNSDQKKFKRLEDIIDNERFQLIYGDLTCDITGITEQVDYVVHLAAQTFVDRSISKPKAFVNDNVVGTFNLLEDCRIYRPKKIIAISTDECYGSIEKGAHTEEAKLKPGNPYSASKCCADMICMGYHNTYELPIIITRCENVYGSFQHRQKMMPVFTQKALKNERLPLYGDGSHVRQWLHVEDKCRALLHIIEKGMIGEVYNIAGNEETTNLDMCKYILDTLGKSHDLIEFIDDSKIRPGHDKRYAIDSTKLRELGWTTKYLMWEGVKNTVEWYKDNMWWFK